MSELDIFLKISIKYQLWRLQIRLIWRLPRWQLDILLQRSDFRVLLGRYTAVLAKGSLSGWIFVLTEWVSGASYADSVNPVHTSIVKNTVDGECM